MSDWRDGWFVCKRHGKWRVYERGSWWDSFDSLPEAHSAALAGSVSDELFNPGGLCRLAKLIDEANWWQAYERACEGAA